MTPTRTIVVANSKCVDGSRRQEWEDWYDEVHLPDLLDRGDTAAVATRWSLVPEPERGLPGLGFSHVTIFEFRAPNGVATMQRQAVRLRSEERIHPAHCITGVSVWQAHGSGDPKPEPSSQLRGHIMAEVMPASPGDEAAWDDWYDAEHLPDMMATGAFAAGTRWVREPRLAFGPNHLTLYDVGTELATAVDLSAAAMPGIVAAGRKFGGHTGVLTLTMEPAGRYGGLGYRPRSELD
jgi:hypothetical protein